MSAFLIFSQRVSLVGGFVKASFAFYFRAVKEAARNSSSWRTTSPVVENMSCVRCFSPSVLSSSKSRDAHSESKNLKLHLVVQARSVSVWGTQAGEARDSGVRRQARRGGVQNHLA